MRSITLTGVSIAMLSAATAAIAVVNEHASNPQSQSQAEQQIACTGNKNQQTNQQQSPDTRQT
jgi:hypothetical protein